MRYDKEAYISPETLRKLGFVRREDGTIYKRSALEMIYEDTKWLKNRFPDESQPGGVRFAPKTDDEKSFEIKFNALNRLCAGQRLSADHQKSGAETCKANDPRKCKVDGCGSFFRPAFMDEAEDRYVAAMRSIPQAYRRVVEKVCIDGQMINFSQSGNLRLGLDFLIKHYLRLSTEKF